MWEFSSLPGESTDVIVDGILEAAQEHDLANKMTGISAYNTNTNCSGLKGQTKTSNWNWRKGKREKY